MARSLSSQKRLRQSKVRAERNKAHKSQVKTAVRKVRDAIQHRDVETAEKALREASKLLDRNGNRKTIHPNVAARRKSRLAKRINELKAAAK
ncbi:MAG: 30S ribosomal protein S20 [Phycisphaerales bacterium]|nr:30S ribosomal protein S20 [Phycisphaerales bacterium]